MISMKRRNTKQRQIVLEAVQGRCDHSSAEAVYAHIHEEYPNISLATVYRNLAILSEEGQIAAIRLPDADRFDLRVDKHYHFICESCGKLYDLPVEYNRALDQMSVDGGFQIHSHQTIFKGLCPRCVKKHK